MANPVYQYQPMCTVDYDGLYCDGECEKCDSVAERRAEEAEYNRREDAALREWLDGPK